MAATSEEIPITDPTLPGNPITFVRWIALQQTSEESVGQDCDHAGAR